MPSDIYDYIIVGAGTAGCLLANRLSADPKARVLLLEAGGKDNYHWIHIPVGYLYLMGNPRADWGFKTAAEPGLNGRSLAYPRGRVLGGCSSINGMIYMRGQARDYDLWRQMGNPGWAWDDVLPYFKQHEDQWALEPDAFDGLHSAAANGASSSRASNGTSWMPFATRRPRPASPRSMTSTAATTRAAATSTSTRRSGMRWNTSKGFLRPVKHRRNLDVETDAMVERLVLDGKRVTGLVMRQHGSRRTIRAAREVVLAAGAIGSPQIMQLSGIGPGAVLQPFGIEVRHELKGVGENLQDHLQVRCAYKVQGVKTMNERFQSLVQRAGFAAQYAFQRRGPMTMAPSQLGAFVKSDPSRETPNLQYHVQPLTLPKFGEPLDPFPAFTASVANIRPTSRGWVRITAPDPEAHPEIRPNYLATQDDRRVAADAIRVTRNIVSMPSLAKYRPEEFRPGLELQSDEALAKAAGDIATTIFHPVGTCKMGSDDTAVVDPRLKVHGLQGLRVADASVMPSITSGNTNSPTLMIAEKASTMILEDARG